MSVCKDHDYCHVKLSEAHNKILKFSQDQKSMKTPFLIYADRESLLEKTDTCDNYPQKLVTLKINMQLKHCQQRKNLQQSGNGRHNVC